MTDRNSLREKLEAIYLVAVYKPAVTFSLIVFSVFAAVLEGIGISFLLPIIRLARNGSPPEDPGGVLAAFIDVYGFLGIPFELEYVVTGVAIVMTVRYTSSFLVAWFRSALEAKYIRHLQVTAFDNALEARISYFDEQGSDEILNAIITQTKYGGRVINQLTVVVEQSLLSLMYLSVALYFAPVLTVSALAVLGAITYLLRSVIESGYNLGDHVADANENIQESVQAGTQGIRDVKLFGMTAELFNSFEAAADSLAEETIRFKRNQAALDNFYQLCSAVTVFVLIYVALTFASLTLASLGIFLFAIFRLAPRMSNLNNKIYEIEGDLPHLVRTQRFTDELSSQSEASGGSEPVPDPVDTVTLDNVSFAYDTGEEIFDGLSLSVDRGDFVGFVGPSGAGKSTIVSLLTRMYEPSDGEILANGVPITEFDLADWRSRISVVRQHPFIFNDTLRRNVTIGNRDASEAEIERVCEIAQVTEFIDDLPRGYDTVLGDDGVRLSGGQKQRVAIARALIKDADLLVLDEATSDLDSTIEETVHEAIESMDRDYAVLAIAHRLSTVTNADRIYTIEDGEVVESGTHQELVDRDGMYAELHATQTRVE
ncbi:ABC transporter ATP-binding protein [Halomicrobium salinisoli]|uniref:ABC transporter ATP-binding protein n=1 Tax=Halomicrobium salinisoli TaxID=2878391 RepID=UPI001CF0A71C|nr:ABC transporter ATP-binding protein [Halomicrobium salinisoli]